MPVVPDRSPPGPAEPLQLRRGPAWRNRLALAPLTNMQSNADGTLSQAEFRWLAMRAEGGFGLVMTCASHVLPGGQAFPGQLGIWSDAHVEGLARLADAIRAAGAASAVQLHHGGRRADPKLTGETPVSPFACPETGARALTQAEIAEVIAAFAAAARRAEAAGFDGVELHGAHGYLLGAFLDSERNLRDDGWGGDFEGRARIFGEVVAAVRAATGPAFQLGLRLSPERFGVRLAEARALAAQLFASGLLDWLDLSLWDVTKAPEEEAYAGTRLIDHFTDLPRHGTALGVAGKILSAARAAECLARGADFVLIGRGAILHHDFAARALADPGFAARPLPVSRAVLAEEGLSPPFIAYMETWPGFVAA
ncbi:NADH:flavin oxidoreductase [Thermaurantiacus tibetensis]|uniref:oxidoreductase n=1 Tax=Thermaurantiacus tibetensis TaxID=2759035 RepID=UPI001890858B|nr:NADH:flavin oxidoreductase [Thermaurantiacus tibetensis]